MPALLTDTVAYANQVLRSKKVEDLNSRRTNPAGRPVEDQIALARQKSIEEQVQSDPSRFLPSQKALLRQPGVEEVIPNSTTANQLGDESVMILSARGTFYLVKLATAYGPGIYAIDELTRSVIAPDFTDPVQNRPGETNSPILLTSIEFNQVDITSQVPCLNNVKVFYSFGQNFGQVVISGEVLLGPLGNISYDGVNRLVDFFWKYRVSVYKKPIAISVANNSYFVYLTGLRISQVNADFHILPFVMFGTLLDIEREKANAVNTTGVVITEGSLEEPSLFNALTAELPDSRRDTSLKKYTPEPDGKKPQLSVKEDPALNWLLQDGIDWEGVAGNTTAIQIKDKLLKQEDVTTATLSTLQSLGGQSQANAIPMTASSTRTAEAQAAAQAANFKASGKVAEMYQAPQHYTFPSTGAKASKPAFSLLSAPPSTPAKVPIEVKPSPTRRGSI